MTVKKTVKKAAVPNKAAKSADLSKWYGKWYIREIVYFSFLFLSSKAARSLSLEDRIKRQKREREERDAFRRKNETPASIFHAIYTSRWKDARVIFRSGGFWMRVGVSDSSRSGDTLGNIGLMVILSPSSCPPSSSFVRAFFFDFVVKKKVKRERESLENTNRNKIFLLRAR